MDNRWIWCLLRDSENLFEVLFCNFTSLLVECIGRLGLEREIRLPPAVAPGLMESRGAVPARLRVPAPELAQQEPKEPAYVLQPVQSACYSCRRLTRASGSSAKGNTSGLVSSRNAVPPGPMEDGSLPGPLIRLVSALLSHCSDVMLGLKVKVPVMVTLRRVRP